MVNASSLVTESISSDTSLSSSISSMSMVRGTSASTSGTGSGSDSNSTSGAVRYCNRCMKVLPIDHFMKGTMIRKSCGGCRERNRLRFAQQKAERSVARESIPITLDSVAGYVRASLFDARRPASSPLHHNDDNDRHLHQLHQSRRSSSPPEQEAFHMLFKVSLIQEPVLRRATPRVIADAVVHRVGEGDGYAWQPGASYVNADNTIAQTFHYRCSLRTDPAKRRNNCHGGSSDAASAARSIPAWRFLDCYNCGGLVKVAIATDHSYAVVTIDHRMLHRRPSQRGIVSSSSSSSSIPSSVAITTSVFNSGQTAEVNNTVSDLLPQPTATPIAPTKATANNDASSWPTPATPVSSTKPTVVSAPPTMAHPVPHPLWTPSNDSIWPVNSVSPINQMVAAQAELLAAQPPTSLNWPHSPMALMSPSAVTTPITTPLPSPRLFNATGVTLLLQHLIQQQQRQRLTPSSTAATPNLPPGSHSSLAVPPLQSSGVGVQTPMLYNASTPMEFLQNSAASIPTTPMSPLGAYPFPIMATNNHTATAAAIATTNSNSNNNNNNNNIISNGTNNAHLTTPGTSPSPSPVTAASDDDDHSADDHTADNTSLLLRHIASSLNQESACPPIMEQQFIAAMQQWQPPSTTNSTPSSFAR